MGKQNEDIKTILEKLTELENRISRKKEGGNKITDIKKISDIDVSKGVTHEVMVKDIGGKIGVNISKKVGDKYVGGMFISKETIAEHIKSLQTAEKEMA